MFKNIVITRRRSCSFAEYWKHFMARFNDVQASGYNSAGSERIWMKFGALRVYCLELALADFGRIRAEPRAGERAEIYFSCPVNNAPLYRFPVSQISRNSHTRRRSMSPWILSKNNLWKFACNGSFSKNVNFCVKIFNDFRLQAAISAKWLQIAKSHDGLANHCIETLRGHLCKDGWTDRDAVWVVDSHGPKASCVTLEVQIPPNGKGQWFWCIGAPIVKYIHFLP